MCRAGGCTIRNWTTLLVVNCYMRHYFHYSRMVLTITILVLAILLYVTMKVCLFTSLTTMVFLCITGCWLPILFAIAFAPICYVKSDRELVLRLLCVTINYELEEYILDDCSFTLTGTTRLFGSGGFLGFYGWYCHRDIGRFLLFSTGRGTRFLKLTHKVTGRVVLIQE